MRPRYRSPKGVPQEPIHTDLTTDNPEVVELYQALSLLEQVQLLLAMDDYEHAPLGPGG
jgi:hypothetical protein